MIGNRLFSGYTNLGTIQIPARQPAIILTDRADGTLWLVSFNTTPPEHLSISTEFSIIRHREGARVYEADDGPKMDESGEYTLMVRGGRIGLDYIPFRQAQTARDDSPPYARKTSESRKLILDTINPRLVHLGYDTND